MIQFYEYMQQPPYWIARDEDGYWLVPARNQGWAEREPFVGRVTGLKEIHDFASVDLGLPVSKSE